MENPDNKSHNLRWPDEKMLLHAQLAKQQVCIDELRAALTAAYAELRKQRPSITAIFDKSVWDAEENYNVKR
jgi:uncharacterized coiled-coil protein SlyX